MEHSLLEMLTPNRSDNPEPPRKAQASIALRYFWLTIGILVGLAFLAVIRWHVKPAASPPHPQAAWQHIREQAWEKIQPRLQTAENAIQTLADSSAGSVETFFEQRKAGARGFAEAVLSLQSKWNLVKSKLPWQDKDSHRKFIDEQFAQDIFTAHDLQKVLEQGVTDYVHGIEGIENKILVDIRADLADFPTAALPELDSKAIFQDEYTRMMTEIGKSVQTALRVDVVRQSGSLVASELAVIVTRQVALAVAQRLGISAGILSTGVASSAVTLGVGAVVGIAVDTIADWVISWYYDPQGKIADKVTDTLNHIERILIQSDEQTPGLKAELQQLGASRSRMRNAALARLIRQGN